MYSSLDLAEALGRKHKSVLRSIRNNKSYWENILDRGTLVEGEYEDSNGRPQKNFILTKEDLEKWFEILNK
jgi:phage regulator Rha-like protein